MPRSCATRAAGAHTLLLIIAFVAFAPPAGAAVRCSPPVGELVDAAWRAYRADSIAIAAARFERADRLCPDGLDARVGLGYAWLRLGVPARAESLLSRVAAADTGYVDAWQGLMYAAHRNGRDSLALRAARRVLQLSPGDVDARAILTAAKAAEPPAPRARRPRRAALLTQARTHGESFEVPVSGGWKTFYVKGINLGVALPGRFPAEFPTDSLVYAGWLDTIATMNANAVRVYTILPPAFYRALAAWNLAHPSRALWLVHGVWAELPDGDDFDDPSWLAAIHGEMLDVLGAVHGDVDIAPHPGHASGRYDADVSRWTLAYIIGREWEPTAVAGFEARSRRPRRFEGRYLRMADGSPMESWTAEQCDWMLASEVARFNTIRPIAYTNWPTLDPLRHPTESTSHEERAWRERVGRPIETPKLEFDNDAIGLDAARVQPTAANPAGWFASFHAYPYYPDFMLHEPEYARARSSEGPSNYFGYLAALHRHLAGMPLLIAEYGVPSSRGLAHTQPQGWSHGGLDENAMAAIDARLTREIRESGCAGGMLFAWIDEWFKKNWAVIDLEIPSDHTPRWHNAMDAEQNYGVLAMVAGPADGPRLGGDASRWLALPALARGPEGGGPAQPASLGVGHDASNLYLAIALPGLRGRAVPWDSLAVQIALDTVEPRRGQHALPAGRVTSDLGFEFLVDLQGPERSRLLVTPGYDPYLGRRAIHDGDDDGGFYHRPATPGNRRDGAFDSMFVIVNRARFGRDGTFFPAQAWERGRLRFGRERESSLADWFYDADAGVIEIRLPWALLNVTDPSSATVLDDAAAPTRDFGTVKTDGFHIGVVTLRKGSGGVLGSLPRLDAKAHWNAREFRTWGWEPWSEPVFHARLKPVYDTMKAAWESSSTALGSRSERP
jgi:hypothetical protein